MKQKEKNTGWFNDIDLFEIVSSQFERDQDHARRQGQGLKWFSGSGVRLCTHLEILPPVPLVVF